MQYAFTCTCKCLFGRYVREGQPVAADCPSCGERVTSAVTMGRDAGRKHHNIISDIQPFKSPIDGTVVSSRRSLRDHEKRHDVIQVGNDRPTRTENAPMRRAGYDVKRAMETARG